MKTVYESNNSGGSWWLEDEDWEKLEAAGWKVLWGGPDGTGKKGDRYCEVLATSAEREGLGFDEAIEEWERITGQRSGEPGCPCCGQPHRFFEIDEDGETVQTGPFVDYDEEYGY